MPFAVTHVILTLILVSLIRDHLVDKKYRKYLSLHAIFIAGIGGLLPDIDVITGAFASSLGYVNTLFHHGGITNTPLFGLIFLIPGYLLWKKKEEQKAIYFFLISFGILLHIFLDTILGGAPSGSMLFWPFSMVSYKLHLLVFPHTATPLLALDAILLLAWLWYEQKHHYIKKYI